MRWVLTPFLRYADFKGRSGRAEFWTFFAVSAATIIFVVLLTGLSNETANREMPSAPAPPGANASPAGAIIYVVWWFASIVPWVAVQARRFHDQGRSGWLAAIGIGGYVAAMFGAMPLAAILFLFALGLMALPGETTENRFGPPIDGTEDGNAAPAGLNSSLAGTRFDAALSPALHENAQTEIGLLAESVEPQQHMPSTEGSQPIRAYPAASTTSEISSFAPLDEALKEPVEQTWLPDDVSRTEDGQYACRGYVFSSRSAAVSYSQRRSTTATALKSAKSLERDDNRPRFSPSDILQAQPETASHLPPGVKPEGNGRFSAGGYRFNSLEQAMSFVQRRSDRSGRVEQSVSPFSSVPALTSPQPVPLKPVRSGFPGFGSSAGKQNTAEHWVSSPTKLSAGGVQFDAYLVYFRTRRSHELYERHRSLIDPSLPVSNGRDPDGSTFSYWPSYSELRPEARRSYLEWLADGRCNPVTPIGYVFIYFYGLERRLVKDRSEADAPAIMEELRRLLAIYGNNGSFRGYCTRLIEMGELLFGDADQPPVPTLDNRYHWELPVGLRIYLGKKVAAGQNLDANDSLCWTLGHPQLHPRTPVTRCFPEFCELWKIRFEEQFPKGLSVREPKTRLNIQFRPASAEFNASIPVENLPDVGAINGPISKFDQMLGSCSEELDPLSRFLGRNPAEADSIIAGALLPEPLRRIENDSAFGRFCRSLHACTRDAGFAEVSIGDLISQMGLPATKAKDERRTLYLKRLPELLDAANFGFEPDKRFGAAPAISEDLKVCVFPAKGGGAVNANRPEYQSARTMAEIAALAARSDDLVVEAEVQSIAADLASFEGISDLDRTRLRAHSMALLANPSKVKAATKRLSELPEVQRQAALASAVRAVLADQRISPAEVRFLEGLYKALGLPQDEVYSRLHSGDATQKPKTKAAGKTGAVSGSAESGAAIDEAKLARLQQETSAVSTMLASIFKEEETASKAPVVEPETVSAAISGLDLAHCKVLSLLADAPMEADAFGVLCRELKLLPSGTIETINDWAFDVLDDYAIKEGEMISIQEHLIEPIKAMRSAA